MWLLSVDYWFPKHINLFFPLISNKKVQPRFAVSRCRDEMWLFSVDVSCCFWNPFEKYCSNTLQSIEAQMKCDTTDLAFPLSSHHIWSVNSCQIEELKCCEIKNRSSKLQDTTYILIFLHFCTKRSKRMSCISWWHICRLTKDGQVPWRRRSTSSSLWWWPNVAQRWQQHKHSQWQSIDLDE